MVRGYFKQTASLIALGILLLPMIEMGGQSESKFPLKDLAAPTEPAPIFDQARALYRSGQFAQALEKFEAAQQAGESVPQLLLYLGMTYAQLQLWEKSLEVLLPLQSQHGADADYWFLLGTAQSSTSHFLEARASLLRSLKISPRNGDAFRILGFVEFQLNHPNSALLAWINAVDANPKDAKACYSIARLFYDANNPVKAREWFQRTIQINPEDYRAILYLGLAYEAEGDIGQALQSYRQALEISKARHQPYSWIYSSLGKLLRNSGDLESASIVLEEGYRLAVDARVCLEYGQLLIQREEKEKAEALFQQAINLEPKLPGPYYQLGLLLRSQGKSEEAQKLMANFQILKEKEKAEKIRLSVQLAPNTSHEKSDTSTPKH